MLACYPGDQAQRYGPHVDNIDGDGRSDLDLGRCLTLVYYVNEPSWPVESQGGALRVYHAAAGSPLAQHEGALHATDVAPSGDTLILFRADQLLHEVRPTHAARFAATMWLYGGSEEQHAAWQREGANLLGR